MVKLLLRLDSGALIGKVGEEDGPVLLPVEKAFAAGRVAQSDMERIQRLLLQMHDLVPDAGPLRSLSGSLSGQKRREPEVGVPEAKRARTANEGNGFEDYRYADVTSRGMAAPEAMDWADKCKAILDELLAGLGKDAVTFSVPVDAKFVPDYYKIIKFPMDLGTVQSKLERGLYKGPLDFCEDVRQVWINCHTYNAKDSPINIVGERADKHFERMWAASGFPQGTRNKRGSAAVLGAHSSRAGAPDKKLKRTSSVRSQQPKNGKKKVANGLVQAKVEKPLPPLPRDHLQNIAGVLAELDGNELDGAIAIIKEAPQFVNSQDDEIELDMDQLPVPVTYKLDKYINDLKKGVGAVNGISNNQLQDSDSDSDSDDDDD